MELLSIINTIPPLILQTLVFSFAFGVSAFAINALTPLADRHPDEHSFNVVLYATCISAVLLYVVFLW